MAFKTANTLHRILGQTIHIPNEEKNIYKIICNDCKFLYKTDRQNVNQAFQGIPSKRGISKTKSNFAHYLMQYNHNYTDSPMNFILIHNSKIGAQHGCHRKIRDIQGLKIACGQAT